jgi:tRNA A-37 threonylcarbamoyl transferase component Bud32
MTGELRLPPRYASLELIASGGMADVYRGIDTVLERGVAIKVLGERHADDTELRARFSREAQTAASLSGEPGVVTIFDVGEAAGRPYIVMELLPGGSLADRLQAGPIPVAQSLGWLEQAGRALDLAHARGIVHRDVKPGNLMLSADGDLSVTDFGIARAAGASPLTVTGTIMGTSGYMSPEQARGGKATDASDRYGLAVVAFELLTGQRPFTGETHAAEAAAHATAPIPRASAQAPSLPPAVDDVLARGLAKEPSERYPTCAELVWALRSAFREASETTARIAVPPRAVTRPQRRLPAVAAALAALGLLGAGALAAALLTGAGDGGREATVIRTQTVAGATKVRRVTIEVPTTVEPPPPQASTAGGSGSGESGSASGTELNDEGYRLMGEGDFERARPLLERALRSLRGSGSLTEAYAAYNLAFTRLALGECEGVAPLLDRSEQVQGRRKEIDRLRKDARRACR